jgi:hypothetical protein
VLQQVRALTELNAAAERQTYMQTYLCIKAAAIEEEC